MNQAQLHKLAADVQRLNDLFLTAGKSLLKGDGGGGVKAAAAGTDYQGPFSYQSAFLSSNYVSPGTAGSFNNILSLSLAAGIWLVSGQLNVSVTAQDFVEAKLWDGSSVVYATSEVRNPDGTNVMYAVVPIAPLPVTLASAKTIKLDASCSFSSTLVYGYCLEGNLGNNASYMTALKIG